MASQDHIRNPIEWGWDQVTLATLTVGSLGRSLGGSELGQRSRRFQGAYRTDVFFLCIIYPLVGTALASSSCPCSGTPLGTCTARWWSRARRNRCSPVSLIELDCGWETTVGGRQDGGKNERKVRLPSRG